MKLAKPATVVIRKGERDIAAWRFRVEPDNPPEVAFAKPPSPTLSGSLTLSYSLKDDYGVVSGSGRDHAARHAGGQALGAAAGRGAARSS